MNSIQSFIIDKDTNKAIGYLAKFSKVMRSILNHSSASWVPLTDELQGLAYYIDIERLRFNEKFDYEIMVDEELEGEFTAIPPMLIQPYVENAIIHGMMHKKGKGVIRIEVNEIPNQRALLISIEDNGVGRQQAQRIKQAGGFHHKSKGMLITKRRLEILNTQYKEDISVEIIDLVDDIGNAAGTRVEVKTVYKDI